ncbi:hypothetical protein [Desulfothermus sp.]
MKRILVASYGLSPDSKTVCYSLDLAKQLGMEVEFFEVVPEKNKKPSIKVGPLKLLKSLMEDAMVAVTYAEHQEHGMAREIVNQAMENLKPYLSKIQNADLKVDLVIRIGDFVKEVVKRVRERKGIILAVIAMGKTHREKVLEKLKQELDIPIIIIET